MGVGLSKSNEVHLFLELKNIANEHGLKLEIIKHGIAFRIKDVIVMNRNLFKYPDYCKSVFDHELRHSGKFNSKDLLMDLAEGSLIKNLRFTIRNPLAFTHFIPIGIHKGDILIDINLIIVYVIAIASVFFYLWVV